MKKWIRQFSPRSWSNDELKKITPSIPAWAHIINVAGWEDSDKEGGLYRHYFQPSIYHISNYSGDCKRGTNAPTNVEINLNELLPSGLAQAYDVSFCHTVLEHLPDPVYSFAQIAKLTRDLLITVVPFKQKLHFEVGNYGDYYRFSPFAMRALYEQNGFTVLYESFTPMPSIDVYLFHVGSRQPNCHLAISRHLPDLASLNECIGGVSASMLIKNVFARFLKKYIL